MDAGQVPRVLRVLGAHHFHDIAPIAPTGGVGIVRQRLLLFRFERPFGRQDSVRDGGGCAVRVPAALAPVALDSDKVPEVEDGDQDFEALRAPRIRRQERGAEPDAVGAQARAVAIAWRANRNRADAGHHLAFGQVAVAHQPSAAFFGARLRVAIKERGNLCLDRPRQQGPGIAGSTGWAGCSPSPLPPTTWSG